MCNTHYMAWYRNELRTKGRVERAPRQPRAKKKTYPAVVRKYATSPKGKATMQRWKANNVGRVRTNNRRLHLKKHYGLSVQEYEAQLAAQKGVCAICRRPPKGAKPLHVDHCHKTGALRGLLCCGCNLTVGFLEKDAARAVSAAKYLQQYT